MSLWGLILAIWFQAVSFLGNLTTWVGLGSSKRGSLSETAPQNKTSCERTQSIYIK